MSLYELVIGDADALEGFDQHNDHVEDAGFNRLAFGCFDYFGVDQMTVNPAPVAPQAEPGTKEHKGLVVGAAGMMVAGFLTTFLSPLLAVSFAHQFGFGIKQAGLLVACGQGGVALSALGILPFLPRLDRRKVGVVERSSLRCVSR